MCLCVQSSNFTKNSENVSVFKLMISQRRTLIYFAEKIVMAILENTNFNFTSLMKEIHIEAVVWNLLKN